MPEWEWSNPEAVALTNAMRNDLTDIFAVTQLLERRVASGDAESYLEALADRAYSLLRLVTNLELANQQAYPLNKCIDISRWLESLAKYTTMLCGYSNVDCRTSLPVESLPVWCEPYYLYHAVCNLIRNSIQYQFEDTFVTLQAYKRKGRVIIKIKDNGHGIKTNAIEQVRNPFFSVDPYGDTDSEPGAGLGLYVAQKIINQHGGTLALSSIFGKGTTVSISLPLANGEAPMAHDYDQIILNRYSPLHVQYAGLVVNK